MKLYVSNLGFHVDDEDLKALFLPFGEVISAKVISDRETGRSRGFGFVEMNSEANGKSAISSLQNKEIEGRSISVTPAKPKENRSFRNY